MANSINDLNFNCNEILQADDLNLIVSNLRAALQTIADLLATIDGLRQQVEGINPGGGVINPGGGGGGGLGTPGTSTIMAFKGFESLEAANLGYNDIKTYEGIPAGWGTTSNASLTTSQMLFMIVGYKLGDTWLKTLGIVWQGPYRLGSSGTTSGTGADDATYNYIYCRTEESTTVPDNIVPSDNETYVSIMTAIENAVADEHGNKNGYDKNGTANSNPGIANYWYDHPYGITPELPCEWTVCLKYTNGAWHYHWGPVCTSHWGQNGQDGDGLEYVFYLLSSNQTGTPSISYEANSTTLYNGRIGENGYPIHIGVARLDSIYLNDDFIPEGWHDEPLDVSNVNPRQYVSTRKKTGALEESDRWGHFTAPKLWNVYATNGGQVTIDNDSIIIDDNTASDAIEYVSLTKAYLWDGLTDVTFKRTEYAKVTVTLTCTSNLTNLLLPCKITNILGDDVITENIAWGTPIQLGTGYNLESGNFAGFCLRKNSSVQGDLPIDTGGTISYTIHAYKRVNDSEAAVVGSRALTFQIKDFNSGTSYSLLVSPNTLGISRTDENSNYTYSGVNSFNVSVTGATSTSVEQVALKLNSSLANEGDLYIEVKKRVSGSLEASGATLLYSSDDNNLHKTITCNLSGVTGNLYTSILSFEVELYYKYVGGVIKVDSETVDFSVKGDKGLDGATTSIASENMKWIFKRFSSISDARSAVNTLNSGITSSSSINWAIPSGWTASDDEAAGTGDLFMAYCYVKEDKFMVLSASQNNLTVYFIWYGPFRIGSTDAGADDENYNYVYCRTVGNSATSFVPSNPATWDTIAKAIENAQNTNSQNTIFVNKDGVTTSNSYVEGYWTDHPLGVTLTEPYEWEVGLTFDGTNYTYAYGPIIRSHFGLNGRDGDGYEYIFYLKPVSGSVPTLSPPYTGKYRNPSDRTLFINVASAVGINSTEYLHDDFIPTGWEDDNQTLSAAYPVEYMSKRKKEDGNWGDFSTPVVWRTYATDGFKVTLDNDVVVFDDDSGNDLVKSATLTKVYLWDGDLDVTTNNSYHHIDVEVTYVGDNSTSISPRQVSSISGSTVTVSNIDKSNSTPNWGSLFSLPSSNYNGFALVKTVSNTKLPQTTGLVVYTVKVYKTSTSSSPEIIASKALSILILDIGDPASYLLLVTPNTLPVSRASSSSSYALGVSSFNVSVLGLTLDSGGNLTVNNITISSTCPSSGTTGFYIVLKTSNGDTITSTPSPTSGTTLTYSISNLSGNAQLVTGNIKYINVELYRYDGTNSTRLDVETVDFSIKGDLGPAGSGQGTEGYVITSLNDGAVIDDLTVYYISVENATLNPIKVYKGALDITASCKYHITKCSLPPYMEIKGADYWSCSGSSVLNSGAVSAPDASLYSGYKLLALTPGLGLINTTWTPGKDYEYDVTVKDSTNTEVLGIKKFRLVVDADISDDGSYYKLIVNNDVISYDSDGTVLSNSTPTISVYHYSTSEELLPFSMVSSLPNNPNSDTIYVVVGSLYYYFNYNSNTKIATMSSYPAYNANGYEISAYKGSRYIDSPEIIDCIKKGADGLNGNNGRDATLYEIIPSESSLHFNVNDSTNEWTPSGLSLTCTATKTVGSTVNTIGYNYNSSANLDGYYLYYKTFSGTTQVADYTQHYGSNPITISSGNTGTRITTVIFYLKTSSGSPIKSCVVPITRDGKRGENGSNSTGNVGRFYYFAGDWNEVDSLKVTATRCPYVYLNGNYYMYIGTLTNESSPISRSSLLDSGASDPSNSTNSWEEMSYNKWAISDAMFANYAHIGSLIINRDWMISLYGYYDDATETDSISYTDFDPVSFMTKLNKAAKIGVISRNSSNTSNPSSLIFRINKALGSVGYSSNAVVNITFKGTVKLFKFTNDNFFKFSNADTVLTGIGTYDDFTYNSNSVSSISNSNSNYVTETIQITRNGTYCFVGGNISKIEIRNLSSISGIFIPNFALDLRSGFTYLNNAYISGELHTLNDNVVVEENSAYRGIRVTNGSNNIVAFFGADSDTGDGGGSFNSGKITLVSNYGNGSKNYLSPNKITLAAGVSNYSMVTLENNGNAIFYESANTPGVEINGNGSTVIANNILGISSTPVAFPFNILVVSGGTFSLPSSPKKGQFILLKGIGNNATVSCSSSYTIVKSDSYTSLGTSAGLGEDSWIIAYPGDDHLLNGKKIWILFHCS